MYKPKLNLKFRRKKDLPEIKPHPLSAQAKGSIARFEKDSGTITIGSTEKDTPRTLWHEQLHKYFFENLSVEASVLWDNIADDLEKYLFGKAEDIPYAYTRDLCPPCPDPDKMLQWLKGYKAEKEKQKPEKEKIFGLGITTYKSGKVENYQKEAWNITQRITRELLPQLKGISVIRTTPTIGYWKGSKEPSSNILFKGKLTPENLKKIVLFKKKYKPESIMLTDYTEKGWTAAEIRGIEEKDLDKLGVDALTYDFEHKRVIVMAEKLDVATFMEKARVIGGKNLKKEQVGVIFL